MLTRIARRILRDELCAQREALRSAARTVTRAKEIVDRQKEQLNVIKDSHFEVQKALNLALSDTARLKHRMSDIAKATHGGKSGTAQKIHKMAQRALDGE